MTTSHSSVDDIIMLHEKNSLLDANRMESTGNINIMRHQYQYGGIAMNGCSRDQDQAEKGVAESNTAPLIHAATTLPHLPVLGLCNIVRPSSAPSPSTDLRDSARIDTVIIAPAEADLPPGTPLLGSSKLVANARSNELRRSRSHSMAVAGRSRCSSSMTLNHSSSFAYLRKMGSFMLRKSDLDRGGDINISMETSCNETTTTTSTANTTPPSAILVKNDACTLEEVETQYRSNFEQAHTHTSFYQDALNFAEGTIPQSIVIALVIGCICGVVAYMYYSTLNFLLTLMWKDMPNYVFAEKYPNIPESLHILWIPMVTFTMSFFCGLSIYFLGEPGDLAYTIQCVHEQGYKATHHIVPMIAASMFTILAGASLGPEAPLVAICAATAGFVSRSIFHQKNKNVIRKHTFMGMAGALSAFFGVPLGGSIFALEVTSRFGIEYFEHLMEAILAGEICVAVFRSLTGLPLGSIWRITPTRLVQAEPYMILLGGGIGLLGAFVAYTWANLHWRLMDCVRMLGLMDDENRYAVPRVMFGALGIVAIGMIVPQTMFWGGKSYSDIISICEYALYSIIVIHICIFFWHSQSSSSRCLQPCLLPRSFLTYGLQQGLSASR